MKSWIVIVLIVASIILVVGISYNPSTQTTQTSQDKTPPQSSYSSPQSSQNENEKTNNNEFNFDTIYSCEIFIRAALAYNKDPKKILKEKCEYECGLMSGEYISYECKNNNLILNCHCEKYILK